MKHQFDVCCAAKFSPLVDLYHEPGTISSVGQIADLRGTGRYGSSKMDTPWHAIHVRSNHEKRVSQHLASRSLEHYLPTYSEKSLWTDRTVTVERPLFPGYVFVRFPHGGKLRVVSTPGVLQLLGNGENGVIPSLEIQRIRKALAEGYSLHPHTKLGKGVRVRVKKGVFAGVEGRVVDIRSNCKVVLSLSGVDQCFSLEAHAGDLEKLEEAGR